MCQLRKTPLKHAQYHCATLIMYLLHFIALMDPHINSYSYSISIPILFDDHGIQVLVSPVEAISSITNLSMYKCIPISINRHMFLFIYLFFYSNPIVSYLIWFYLSCLVFSYLVWSYLSLSTLILSYMILFYRILSYCILSYPIYLIYLCTYNMVPRCPVPKPHQLWHNIRSNIDYL